MHIAEGVLSLPVLVTGGAVAALGTAVGLRHLDADTIPRAGVGSAALFAASLIHVRLGASSLHLVLNGVAGLLLGSAVFPAFLVSLFLQAVLFQFGGLLVLGVNTAVMACSGFAAGMAARFLLRRGTPTFVAGCIAGGGGLLGAALLAAAALAASGEAFGAGARLLLVAHLPLAAVEAAVGGCACTLLLRRFPDLFQ